MRTLHFETKAGHRCEIALTPTPDVILFTCRVDGYVPEDAPDVAVALAFLRGLHFPGDSRELKFDTTEADKVKALLGIAGEAAAVEPTTRRERRLQAQIVARAADAAKRLIGISSTSIDKG